MTLLALRAFVARIPGITWVVLGAIVALAVASWSLYRHGEHVGEHRVARAALVDSVRVAHVAVDTATAITKGRVAIAARRGALADSSRVAYHKARPKYTAARTAIDSLLVDAPPAIVAFVAEADSNTARADVAVAQSDTAARVDSSAFAAVAAERVARVTADTLEAHEAKDPDPSPGGHAFPVKVILVTTGAVLLLLHFVR